MHAFCVNMFLIMHVKVHSIYMCMKCLDFQDFCLEKNAHLIVILSISGTRRAEDVEVTAKREFGSRTEASQ